MSCFILPPESQAMRGLLSYLLRLRSQQSTFTRPCPCLLRKNAFQLTRAGIAWRFRNPIPQNTRTSASSAALLDERPGMLITDVPKWTMTAALPSQPRIMRAADQFRRLAFRRRLIPMRWAGFDHLSGRVLAIFVRIDLKLVGP